MLNIILGIAYQIVQQTVTDVEFSYDLFWRAFRKIGNIWPILQGYSNTVIKVGRGIFAAFVIHYHRTKQTHRIHNIQ